MASDQKTVLAALLAVKRGFVTPEQAMQLLSEAGNDSDADHAVKTIATHAPDSDFERELEAANRDPDQALEDLGVSEEARGTLFEVSPSKDALRQTLVSIAPASASESTTTIISDGDRYEIKQEHARGGMGRILIALDKAVGREVALKELLPGGSGSGSPFTPASNTRDAVERFLREARVTGKLEHPNIVPVYEIGQRDDGSLFYTMKFVRGKSMAHELKSIAGDGELNGKQKLQTRIRLLGAFQDVCNAVAYAHSRGVIHRDLKPANIMLGDFGETLVLDWGLARHTDAPEENNSSSAMPDTTEGSGDLTMDGAVMGTPAYMAPEQARGETDEVDRLSDVYALGAILYEILTGCPPYEGGSGSSVVNKVINGAPKPVREVCADAPPELVALCEHAMARDKSKRIKEAKSLADETEAYRDGRALSVYRYTSGEMLRRFASRNRAVITAVALALVGLFVLGTLAFVGVASERDRAVGAEKIAFSDRQKAEESAAVAKDARHQAEVARADAEEDAHKARESDRIASLRYTELLMRDGERLEKRGDWDKARELYSQCRDEFIRLGEEPVLANLWMAYANGHGPGIVAELGENHVPNMGSDERPISQDGRYIAVGTTVEVGVYDLVKHEYCFRKALGGSDVFGLAFFDEGRTLCLSTEFGLRAWDIETGTEVFRSTDDNCADQLCEAGAHIALYGDDTLALLDRETKEVTATLGFAEYSRFDDMISNADGSILLLLAGTRRNTDAQMIRYEDGKLNAHEFKVGDKRVVSGEFLPGGRALLGLDDGTLSIFDFDQMLEVHSRKLLRRKVAHTGWHESTQQSFAADDNGRVAFCTGSDLQGGGAWPELRVEPGSESISFAAGGTRLALSTTERPYRLYELLSSTSIPVTNGHVGVAFALPLNEGLQVASGGEDGQVLIWDVPSREVTERTEIKALHVTVPIAASRDGATLIVAELDRRMKGQAITAYSLPGMMLTWRRTMKTKGIPCFALSPDEELCVLLTASGRPALADPATGTPIKGLAWGDSEKPTKARFNATGTHVAIGNEHRVCVYDVETLTLSNTYNFEDQDIPVSELLDINPDLRHVTARLGDDAVIDLQTMNLRFLPNVSGWATYMNFASEHVILATRDTSLIEMRHADTGNLESQLVLPVGAWWSMRTASTSGQLGGQFAACGSSRGSVVIFEHTQLPFLAPRKSLTVGSGTVLSPNGKFAMCGSSGGDVWLWQTDSRTAVAVLPHRGVGVTAVCIADGGRDAVTGDENGTLRVWDAQSLELRASVKVSEKGIRDVAFSADGNRVFGIDIEGKLGEWSWPNLDPIRTVQTSLPFTFLATLEVEHGICIASQYGGATVLIDLSSFKETLRIEPGTASIQSARITPDGKRLMLLGITGTLEMWDIESGQQVYRVANSQGYLQLRSQCDFLGDGKYLLTPSSTQHAIQLRETETGNVIREFSTKCQVEFLRVSEDGTQLIYGGENRMYVWRNTTHGNGNSRANLAADRGWWTLANAYASDSETPLFRGHCALHAGQPAHARKLYEEVGPQAELLKNGLYAEFRRQGEVARSQGRLHRARQRFEQSVQLLPTARGYERLAQVCHNLKDYLASVSAYASAVKLGLDDPSALMRYAVVLHRIGKSDEAIEVARNVSGRDWGDYESQKVGRKAYHLIGRIYLETDRPSDAIPELSRAAAFERDGQRHFELALAYLRTGRAVATLGYLKVALISGSQFDDRVLKGDEFKPIRALADFQETWDEAIKERAGNEDSRNASTPEIIMPD